MFKNAGSTFDSSLQRSFAGTFVDHRDDVAMRRGADYLGPYIQQHADLQSISSHWVTFPLPKIPNICVHLALLFRDPLERIFSVYRFERGQQLDSPGGRQARELDFPDYVRWRLQSDVGPVIRNYQTRYCSGTYRDENLETMYLQALSLLDSTPLIGLVDRYEESMALFEYHLRPVFPSLDLSARPVNTSDPLPVDAGNKREQALRELSTVLDEATAANYYDIRLYKEATVRFERALRAVPDISGRIEDLRLRNEQAP